jgi:hypothetical protein
MFKKNKQSNKTSEKPGKLGNKSKSRPTSGEQNVTMKTSSRQYTEEFVKNYATLKKEEFKCKFVPKNDETVVLHRYEISRSKSNENESNSDEPDDAAYKTNTNYLAMNQFDRLVYRLSGNFMSELEILGNFMLNQVFTNLQTSAIEFKRKRLPNG